MLCQPSGTSRDVSPIWAQESQFKFPSNSEATTWSSGTGSHLLFKNMSIYFAEILTTSGNQVTTTTKLLQEYLQWEPASAGAQGTSRSGLPIPQGPVYVPGERRLYRGGTELLNWKSELNVSPHHLYRCAHRQSMGTGSHTEPFPASRGPKTVLSVVPLVTGAQNGDGEKVQPQNQTRLVD